MPVWKKGKKEQRISDILDKKRKRKEERKRKIGYWMERRNTFRKKGKIVVIERWKEGRKNI